MEQTQEDTLESADGSGAETVPFASILIVEDESLIALELKKKLEEAGYTVSTIVDNAVDALLSVESLGPDLVLMDIRLHGPGDGIETAEEIRRRFRVPVMFVTAHADRETLDRARIAEPFGYLVKPFLNINFRAPIEMALRKHKTEQELQLSQSRLSNRAEEKAAVLDAAPHAVIMVGPDGLISLINTETERLFGYSRQELLGQPIEMLIPERFRPHHGGLRAAFFSGAFHSAHGSGAGAVWPAQRWQRGAG